MRLRFVPAVLVLAVAPLAGAGCALLHPRVPPLAGTAWHLVTYAAPGSAVVVNAPPPDDFTLAFGHDGQATGRSDCNRYFGAYTQTAPDGLRLGPLGATRMACEGSDESAYFAALERTTRVRRDADQLTLTTSDGSRLVYTRVGR